MEQMVVGEDGNVTFEGVSEVIGADVFLTDGATERLDKEALEQPLFQSLSEKVSASAGQLLTAFFQQTGTTPADYVDRQAMIDAMTNGEAISTARLEVRFGDSAIKFKRGEELVDPERVVFDLQITFRPRNDA